MKPRLPTRGDIVICGYPRSGSTLLYNMIRATVANYRTFDREHSAVGLREPGPWISKHPADRRYPDLPCRRIITIRDPRDVLCSVHSSLPDTFKVSADHVIAGRPPGEVMSEGLIEIDAQVQALAGVTIRYEELCSDPGSVQERLRRKLGLQFVGAFEDFHKADIPDGLAKQLNGVRPVTQARIGAWRNHPERIREQFARFPELHEILIRRGYEKDERWIDSL